MFIQTEATPNPATLKFIPGQAVVSGEPREFLAPEQAEISPLARRLFDVNGVTGVFLGADFITVTKQTGEWRHLKPAILGVIMEHYMSGAPVLNDDNAPIISHHGEEFFDAGDEDIVATIKELIDTRVRPAVAQDGGDITFQGFREGTVFLHMKGACAGCPSSTATLKYSIENLLRHFIPEVSDVQQVV